jgi:hypothetical protein
MPIPEMNAETVDAVNIHIRFVLSLNPSFFADTLHPQAEDIMFIASSPSFRAPPEKAMATFCDKLQRLLSGVLVLLRHQTCCEQRPTPSMTQKKVKR